MLKSSLHNYSEEYILVTETIKITGARADACARQADKRNKQAFAPFTDCISQINNVQEDNVVDLDVVILVHNLIDV